MSVWPRWSVLAAPLAATAALSAALLFIGRDGWPGAPNPCVETQTCYCEAFRPGGVAQPANNWSCLAFVAAALLCAAHAARGTGPSGARMAAEAMYPALFCTGLALIGPASMALHASMTDWGGRLDGSSMDFFIAFAVAFGLSRRRGWGARPFLAALALGTAVPVLNKLVPGGPRGEVVFGLMVAALALIELLPEGATRIPDRRWLSAAAGLFLAGATVWALSVSTTSLLCVPDSLLQGHALWHLLTAAAAACLYPHFLGEPARAA